MKREFVDLSKDLGRGNWIDAAAGEAVVLGYILKDPELENRGSELAKMVRETSFDHDNFFKVEACARGLENYLKSKKEEWNSTVFIDAVRKRVKEAWPGRDWEYDFICLKRYQVWMNLPNYNGMKYLLEEKKQAAEKAVRQVYSDPSFTSYRCEREEVVNQGQKFITTTYYDNEGRVLRKIVNHEHAEPDTSKGWLEKFYFDDFSTAVEAWVAMKEVVI